METELALDLPIAFAADGEPVAARLKRVRRGEAELVAVVETDPETASRIAARGWFHDTAENRLAEVQGGFNSDLPVMIELASRTPSLLDTDLRAAVERLATSEELLREDAWNALEVWQEHRLDPSIGGGVIKVGYRTVFSTPRNEIDALKRRGLVTRTIVEALIENGLPVHFEPHSQAFVLGLAVGDSEYACRLRPDDEATGIMLTVTAGGDARTTAHDVIDEVNAELAAGAFELADGTVRYVHEIRVDEPLVSESWVIETLRSGVSVMHHYAPRLDPRNG
jgi:hypothetical protein